MNSTENNIYNKIIEFETEENIKRFSSEYGNLWPVFKMYISRSLLSETSPKYRNNIYRTLSKLKTHLSTIKNYKFKKFKKVEVDSNTSEIWFSNHELRYENSNNYNKYLDPFFIEMSETNALMYEHTTRYPYNYSFPHLKEKNQIKNLTPLLLRYNNKIIIRKLIAVYKNEYNDFINTSYAKLLVKHFPNFSLYGLFIEYLSFLEYYNFYISFFSNFTKLKKVYLVAYYMTSRMAMFAAAVKNNIQTIDIQHNIMSKKHFAYGLWEYIPKGGYGLLPNSFYVFTENERKLLSGIFKNQHEVKVIENQTFKKWVSEKKTKSKKQKKTILISLQNSVIQFDSFLIKALMQIQENNKGINLVFRLHPRHTYIKEETEEVLKKANILFHWDSNSEVYDTLSETIVNITSFSTVVNDALLFKIPSIVYTKKGIEIFEEEIKNNPIVHSALNLQDFLNIINKYI